MPTSHSSLSLATSQRSALMKRVGRKDTAPELAVRRYLHREGLRFRLHARQLPGTPDFTLPRYRVAVFVHGCFWHGHNCPHGSVRAKTNAEYWQAKIAANRVRDARKERALRDLGWVVQTIWECESTHAEALDALIRRIRLETPDPKRRVSRNKVGERESGDRP